jgi:hypothetical protein
LYVILVPSAVGDSSKSGAPVDFFSEGSQFVLTHANLNAAESFIWNTARVIDRRRFDYLFRNGDAEPVVDALRAYRNADGGFGHALEPDGRGSESQPLHALTALNLLDETGHFDDPMVAGLLDWFVANSTPDGGLPSGIPTARDYPHAPWWTIPEGEPTGSLLMTANIVGVLLKHDVQHPWVERASAFCWQAIRALETSHPYEIEGVLNFLNSAREREEAEHEAARLGELVERHKLVVRDPESAAPDTSVGYGPGELHTPLNYATRPESLARRWFTDAEIEHNLDLRERAQQPDGGWMFDWGQWNPASTLEWRGVVTIEALALLRAYGRLD